MKEVITRDVAESELEAFADAMDLELESANDQFVKNREKFIKAVMRGSLVVDPATGEPIFTPTRSDDKEPVRFYEPTGANLQEMDRITKGDITKMYALMGSITHTSAARFSGMRLADVSVCMAITGLFMD